MTSQAENSGQRVGVIGLGALGRPVAERILRAGYPTAVYDVRAQPMGELAALGAAACRSPAELGARSDIIIGLVSDTAQTDAIVSGVGGILETMRPGTIFATGSTLGPAPVQRIACDLAAKGGFLLDIPISGGIIAAREGTLSLMAGGDADVLDRARPVLKLFARDITHTGGIGSGADALEMISVGATAVGVGTALAACGEGIFARILDEMGGWMVAHGFDGLAAIRSRAHRAAPVGGETNLPPVPGWRPHES